MPQLQSIVLTDRTPVTPVNLTFTPLDIKDGIGSVVNSSGVPIGNKRLTVSMKKTNTRWKGTVRLDLPVVATETVNGISKPVVVRTAYAELNVSFDERSTEQERTDAIGLLSSGLSTSKVLINDALVKLEGVY
ncbi:MAG: putative coat protein [Yuhrihovirus faecenecus]|uniref:Coat protein n=1 Tax=Leviviridae sp. TaxID=2027243 RepID=A0ABY3SSB8_9VIRU|nr:MAG: putative coat protein [Leviviridae sp.]